MSSRLSQLTLSQMSLSVRLYVWFYFVPALIASHRLLDRLFISTTCFTANSKNSVVCMRCMCACVYCEFVPARTNTSNSIHTCIPHYTATTDVRTVKHQNWLQLASVSMMSGKFSLTILHTVDHNRDLNNTLRATTWKEHLWIKKQNAYLLCKLLFK